MMVYLKNEDCVGELDNHVIDHIVDCGLDPAHTVHLSRYIVGNLPSKYFLMLDSQSLIRCFLKSTSDSLFSFSLSSAVVVSNLFSLKLLTLMRTLSIRISELLLLYRVGSLEVISFTQIFKKLAILHRKI